MPCLGKFSLGRSQPFNVLIPFSLFIEKVICFRMYPIEEPLHRIAATWSLFNARRELDYKEVCRVLPWVAVKFFTLIRVSWAQESCVIHINNYNCSVPLLKSLPFINYYLNVVRYLGFRFFYLSVSLSPYQGITSHSVSSDPMNLSFSSFWRGLFPLNISGYRIVTPLEWVTICGSICCEPMPL